MNDVTMIPVMSDAVSCSSAQKRLERMVDALAKRLSVAEATLECIERETNVALVEPSIAFTVTRRVSALARAAVRKPDQDVHDARAC